MDIHTAIVAVVIIDCGDGGFVEKACFFRDGDKTGKTCRSAQGYAVHCRKTFLTSRLRIREEEKNPACTEREKPVTHEWRHRDERTIQVHFEYIQLWRYAIS